MSTEFFCCSDIHPPYEGVGHEVHKLNEFIKWAKTTLPGPYETNPREPAFIIELQQRNSSSLLPPRYFIPIEHHFRHDRFQEIHKASVEEKFQLVPSSRQDLECDHHHMYYSIMRHERNHTAAHLRDPFGPGQSRLGHMRQLFSRSPSSVDTSSATHAFGLSSLMPRSHRPSSSGSSSYVPSLLGLSSFSHFGDFDKDSAVSSYTSIETCSNSAQADADASLPSETEPTSSDNADDVMPHNSDEIEASCEPDLDDSDILTPSSDNDEAEAEAEGNENNQDYCVDIEDTEAMCSGTCSDDYGSYDYGNDFCGNDCGGCDFSDDY
ncbi:hypothetical protein N7541_008687 [Penicillium brevicompactum]|uniref:Uncharacterized protein n=1 Tax=Penicillium brevicompactum TaxID=5074 RepID=A0A9W9QZM1_PENBR|nr:hypothetical protein N7541_008687 [Penicillium brevicompactum]